MSNHWPLLWRERWFAARLLAWAVAAKLAWAAIIAPGLGERADQLARAEGLKRATVEERQILGQVAQLRTRLSEEAELLDLLQKARGAGAPPPDTLEAWANGRGITIASIRQSTDSTAQHCEISGNGTTQGLLHLLSQLRKEYPLIMVEWMDLRNDKQSIAISSLRLAWPLAEASP